MTVSTHKLLLFDCIILFNMPSHPPSHDMVFREPTNKEGMFSKRKSGASPERMAHQKVDGTSRT